MSYLSLVPAHELFGRQTGLSPASIHLPEARRAAVMRMFGTIEGETPRVAGGILFRLEPGVGGRAPSFLVRSEVEPVHVTAGTRVKQFTDPVLTEGTPVAFRVAVNGVRRRSFQDRITGREYNRVIPVRADHEDGDGPTMSEWLASRPALAEAFESLTVINHERELIGLERNGSRRQVAGTRDHVSSRHALQIDSVDGSAVVKNPDALLQALRGGVGRSKAFGCGLLTVSPIR